MRVFLSNYVGIFICRVRRLFWSAPSFLRWRDQNFTPSVQAGSQPLLEVSWQHTYYTRYSNTHIRSINLSNDVFKRYTLMNSTYFFGNNLFHFGGFWHSLGKLAHTNTTSTNGGIQYIHYMRFKIVYFFTLYFKFFYVVYE